ncbi:glycosyltransferase involved in cell wall biosynthesis [Motilibacter rhizosphaerae]|uniref:Glycosyltransferase involved in cell wall biosynthesis n=1 Tax=Motilibacter rhizosphaerae TaxID=598652 RepID=A0A4Q7NVW1_9ACTN|nr:glycosyltransferase family 4 protein [Motilibacter rhizosphaerae]RZS91401.1 glycosyltransferase involved in cell wall biosynthesis [Motilibacter rhizosphaerae]
MTSDLVLNLGASAEPKLTWLGPMRNFSGFGDEMRHYVLGLRDRGHAVRALPVADSPKYMAGLSPTLRARLDAAVAEPAQDWPVLVQHLQPHTLRHYAGVGYYVGRTMFETTSLPAGWAEQANGMDELWVPSEFNVQTFRDAGVTIPIHVVPEGVSTTRFRPGLRPLVTEGLRGTVFLSVFEWSSRKGWDVLLRAWAEAFGPEDDVTLLLRSYPLSHTSARQDEISQRVDAYLATLGRTRADVAPIVVLDQFVDDREMPRLYASATAYVGPSRGEGWGRPYLEAMATGLPTIATRWSGNLAFMDDTNSLLVDIDGLETVPADDEIAFFRGQQWASPSVASLVGHLRWVAAEPAAAAALGARAREDVVARWTWEKAVDVAEQRFLAIREHLTRPRPHAPGGPRVRWVGEQFQHTSLSLVNRAVVSRLLDRVDVECRTVERPAVDPYAPELAALASTVGPVLDGDPQVEVRHQWPPDWSAPEHQGALVAIQPWEYGGLPDAWVEGMAAVDEAWVPTTFVRDCYVASGVPAAKVHVVPNGVDVDAFSPQGEALALRTTKGTKLLFVGGTIHRKGIDVLVAAYLREFTRDDDVCLVVKTFGSGSVYRGQDMDERLRQLAADPSLPEIEVIDRELEPHELPMLYRACDVLVHPYRGEGFGLPIAEAMACGLPVVVTGAGAAVDFCDAETAYLVPAEPQALSGTGLPESRTGYFLYEPDGDALARTLRHVVEHPAEAAVRAAAGRSRIVRDFSWERVAGLVAGRLAALAAAPATRLRPLGLELDTQGKHTFGLLPDWTTSAPDEALRTFVAAFTPADEVCLAVWIDPSSSDDELDRIEERLRAAVEAGTADGHECPDILLVTDALRPGELDRFYRSVDVALTSAPAQAALATSVGTPLLVRPGQEALRASLAQRRVPAGV